MLADQAKVFAESEGDRWFQRNKGGLDPRDLKGDMPLRLMTLYSLRPTTVLEIGASNGYRLAAIAERFGARAIAVEPSLEAIRDGRSRFPNLEFIRATADAIPLREPVDLIIVNFVFHWLDRSKLLSAVAEIDRLLVDNSYLILGDFLPANRTRVRYHHRSDLRMYTYKQNYADVFLASGLYETVGMLAGGHGSADLKPNGSQADRVATTLLHKQLEAHYVEAAFNGTGDCVRDERVGAATADDE